MNDPFSLAFTLVSAAQIHQYGREVSAAREQAEAGIILASEQGFVIPLAVGKTVRGWALSLQGWEEESLAQLQEGVADFKAVGAKNLLPYLLALLAEAYGKVGRTEAGLHVLSEALTQEEGSGEHFYEAELYRLKGGLTLEHSKVHGSKLKDAEAEAEACFLKALAVAQKQQAKSLELRAAMSLARLWQRQGKQHEARNLLSETYGWFTEGFDTKDLQEAKALLEELAEGR